MSPVTRSLTTVAADLAQRLASPPPTPPEQQWRPQSLAKGPAGIALLHIERAHADLTGWDTAHAWLKAAAAVNIRATDDAGLFYGAPAVAFALHAANGPGRYARPLASLDTYVTALTHRRVDQAHARIDRGDLPELGEFDLIYGLTGIGAHLLQLAPHSDALARVLTYLVRLTEPLRIDGETFPGWWTGHDPFFKSSPDFPGGHGNFGMAHGIIGPLALLSLAMRSGAVVDGHADAIERICAWLDTWRQEHDGGLWWPQWITHEELQARRLMQAGPMRPSWCYGTPGLARAQQLAGIATGDTARQHMAEQALADCLSDPAQLGRIIDTSLCHGWGGLFQTVWRAARDAHTTKVAAQLPHVTDLLAQHGHPGEGDGTGFLEGDAGLALALYTAGHTAPPMSGWDACLLLN